MLSDIGFQIDFDAMDELLRRGDVITVGFSTFPERLLIDTRVSSTHGPLVAVVDPVANVQERYLWLGQHRGMFGAPQAFSFFMWPQTIRGLVTRDALRVLKDRMRPVSPDFEQKLNRSLDRLLELERLSWDAAIRGDQPWATLWQAA